MPSNFQSNEPEAVSGSELQPQPQANRIEIARYDEEMQQRIIALAGALQDRERATVSLTQLEAAAQEAGLEPRFVREAARRLAAASSAFPLVTGEDGQFERRATQSQGEIERAAQEGYPLYGALAESNHDSSSPPLIPAAHRVERIDSAAEPTVVLRPLPRGLQMRSTEVQESSFDTFFAQADRAARRLALTASGIAIAAALLGGYIVIFKGMVSLGLVFSAISLVAGVTAALMFTGQSK